MEGSGFFHPSGMQPSAANNGLATLASHRQALSPTGGLPRRTPDLAGTESLDNGAGPGRRVPLWKPIFDIALVFLTLPVWLPLMLLISAAIKIASRGPVIYRQERIGIGGVPFMLFKFRSMKVNAGTQCHEKYLDHLIKSNSPMTKLDSSGDARLIPGGKWLRASAMDELPQLFNVLRGEMSLVGPRPCTTHEYERYTAEQKLARTRVLPGLTGYWQVNGKNRTTFSEMIAMDVHYAERLTLALDLTIIIKTIPVLVQQVVESRRNKRRARESGSSEQVSKISSVEHAV